MRRIVAIVVLAVATAVLSGCVDILMQSANRSACKNLPGTAKRDCLQRRGESELPFGQSRIMAP